MLIASRCSKRLLRQKDGVLQERAQLEEDLIARAIAAALGAAHGVPYNAEGTPHPDAAAEATPVMDAAAEAEAAVDDIEASTVAKVCLTIFS